MNKLKQKEPTKSLDERTTDIMAAVQRLRYMPKFPTEPDQLQFLCGIWARFVQTVEVYDWSDDPELQRPDWDLGWVNPLDWLIGKIAETCEFFPPPIKVRRLYGDHFRPLDGKYAEELTAVLEY